MPTPLSQAPPPDMSAEACALWQTLIQQRCGLYFSESRLRALRQHLWERMQLRHLHNYSSYYHLVAAQPADNEEWQALLELLLNHETSFFRHLPSYHALRTHVLPGLFSDPQREQTLTIWSAGCATGQEAYSLAMACDECTIPPGWRVCVIGSDVSHEALDKARIGQYKLHELRQLPEYYRHATFVSLQSDRRRSMR